jgi:integrase
MMRGIHFPRITHRTPHMASIQKTAKGYRAQVYVSGTRESKVFRTQREAKAWGEMRSQELRTATKSPPEERHTMADAMRRYVDEVSPGKRGHRWEAIRSEALLRDTHFPSGVILGSLTTTHFAEWRDARTRQVQAGTVLREISFISAVLECARIEWQWLQANPIKDIRKPRTPDHREVTIAPWQVRRMLQTMRYSSRLPIRTVAQAVAVCFLTALRTGMRAGELTGLTWDRVKGDHAVLPITKTFPRKVPLSSKAIRLIDKMNGYDPERVFGMNSRSLDANFRKYRERAGLDGFSFHDSRHTAATMLSRKLDVMDLCRMFGWTDTRMALRYYNPSASSIADILNR